MITSAARWNLVGAGDHSRIRSSQAHDRRGTTPPTGAASTRPRYPAAGRHRPRTARAPGPGSADRQPRAGPRPPSVPPAGARCAPNRGARSGVIPSARTTRSAPLLLPKRSSGCADTPPPHTKDPQLVHTFRRATTRNTSSAARRHSDQREVAQVRTEGARK
jgi:hypothetical protein